MRSYLLRRFLYMLVLLATVSLFSFVLIQLPPGDYLSSYISRLRDTRGTDVDQAEIDALRMQYGLDQPLMVQYVKWIQNMFQGDFGRSFAWNMPVSTMINERLGVTIFT